MDRSEEILQKARELGADEVYFLQPARYEAVDRPEEQIPGDPFEQLPQTRCIVALLLGYAPYNPVPGQALPACYYPASNRLYHMAKELIQWMQEQGMAAVQADLPIKQVLEKAKIGAVGINGLSGSKPLGTRFGVQLILTDSALPREYGDRSMACTRCGACIRACPVGAIGENGVDGSRCLRQQMDGRIMTPEVKSKLTDLLGCDICQKVCPRNRHIPARDAPPEIVRAFGWESLFSPGYKKRCTPLVGPNMLTHGRLRAQAMALAAKMGLPPRAFAGEKLTPCEADALEGWQADFSGKKREFCKNSKLS